MAQIWFLTPVFLHTCPACSELPTNLSTRKGIANDLSEYSTVSTAYICTYSKIVNTNRSNIQMSIVTFSTHHYQRIQ